jgi:transposase-like protein
MMIIKMTKCYRVLFQTYDKSQPNEILTEKSVLESDITTPTNCLDFSIGMSKQLKLVKDIQSNVLQEKVNLLSDQKVSSQCPKCDKNLSKGGKQTSTFHDVFTDHSVVFQRFRCRSCGYELPCTVKQTLGTIQSGELKKIQSELGATHTYRESQQLLTLFSSEERYINNHDRIKHVSESVGASIEQIHKEEKLIASVKEAKELVLNVDGGHIKTNEQDKRSMEAMTAVIYQPDSIIKNKKDTRNYLVSKNCAASVSNDSQEQIISSTILAALKQGMGANTKVTALCDGASNCWNVVEAIKPLCGSMTCILDWFHLAMKIENISLPATLKESLLKVKWYLWRGDVTSAITRLKKLIDDSKNETHIERLKKFSNYITNNITRIVNYSERKDAGLVFTSNLAESTVESLINRRCKGQQHMRWSRNGLNPLLQIRAAMHSKGEWEDKWQTAVLNAA